MTGCTHVTAQTVVLIECLIALGAEVRWCGANAHSTQDEAAAAAAAAGAAVFAWRNQSLADYWRCVDRALTWPGGRGPDVLVEDGGDACLLVHEGAGIEALAAAGRPLPLPRAGEGV